MISTTATPSHPHPILMNYARLVLNYMLWLYHPALTLKLKFSLLSPNKMRGSYIASVSFVRPNCRNMGASHLLSLHSSDLTYEAHIRGLHLMRLLLRSIDYFFIFLLTFIVATSYNQDNELLPQISYQHV